jgi:hypothetical protein
MEAEAGRLDDKFVRAEVGRAYLARSAEKQAGPKKRLEFRAPISFLHKVPTELKMTRPTPALGVVGCSRRRMFPSSDVPVVG